MNKIHAMSNILIIVGVFFIIFNIKDMDTSMLVVGIMLLLMGISRRYIITKHLKDICDEDYQIYNGEGE